MINEAAERLRLAVSGWGAQLLEEALAAERRATVERIRAECVRRIETAARGQRIASLYTVLAFLDEEAAR